MTVRSGYVLMDKPAGVTSFGALGALKRSFPGTKVGHTGTLDRFATGLLVALTGSCSRLAPWFSGLDKEYRATIRFGVETSTLDPEGETVAEGPLPGRAMLESVLPRFTGDILQAPPEYSAVHVDGVRAWRRALAGEAPLMKPRPVRIDSIVLESFDGEQAVMHVACSSGTYIRSLARDIALACGSRSHLVALRRLSVGPFRVEDTVANGSLDGVTEPAALTPPQAALLRLRPRELCGASADDFLNGRKIPAAALRPLPAGGSDARAAEPAGATRDGATSDRAADDGASRDGSAQDGASRDDTDLAVFDRDGMLLGIARTAGGFLRYLCVLPREAPAGEHP